MTSTEIYFEILKSLKCNLIICAFVWIECGNKHLLKLAHVTMRSGYTEAIVAGRIMMTFITTLKGFKMSLCRTFSNKQQP